MKNFLLTTIAFLLTVNFAFSQQTPFGNSPMAIPGKIEAEDFDNGGEGVAFSIQTNPNVGDYEYRPEYTSVGIEQQADGTVNIGFTGEEEWLKYTVDVAAGDYLATIRYACGVVSPTDERGIKVFLDDVEIMDMDTSNVGGDWTNFLTYTVPNITLPESSGGTLKILWKTKGFNLDYIEFSPITSLDNTFNSDSEEISVFPSPFVNSVNVAVSLLELSEVNIKVYSLTGQEMAVLYQGEMSAGDHKLVWDGRTSSGVKADSGLYFIQMNVNRKVLTRKIIKQ